MNESDTERRIRQTERRMQRKYREKKTRIKDSGGEGRGRHNRKTKAEKMQRKNDTEGQEEMRVIHAGEGDKQRDRQ